MSMIALRALQAFDAVGRLGSVTAAAGELVVSPGAVSQHLRKLEAHLGVSLLERRGRRIALTALGRLYHAEIAKGFLQFQEAENVLSRARNGSGLTLSALSSVVNKWIGRRIFDWQGLHPDAQLRLLGQDAEPRLGIDEVDFRITYGQRGSQHPHSTALFRDWVVPACAPALIEAQAGPVGPAEILRHPLLHVAWEPHFSTFPHWRDFARAAGVDFAEGGPGLSFTLSSSAIDAAVNKRGFVLAQMSMITDELAANTLVVPFDLRLPLPESYFLAWDRSALDKPHGPAFHAWLTALGRRQGQASAP
ncbi:LysR family transcriptional regulator [Rhizobium sp. Leaf371]|nr:LysR family transcriptional regulator [Rhizobium sp. Leaf371]